MLYQRTIAKTVDFTGIGLHTGRMVAVSLRPAAANTGILFKRTDIPQSNFIKASPENVMSTDLATKIGNQTSHVSTVEHLMAALFGFGIDNIIIELDGPELPIVDGSALPFAVLIDEAGVQELSQMKTLFAVQQTIEVVDPKDPLRFIRVEPSSRATLSYQIDFSQTKHIGNQCFSIDLNGTSFFEEAVFARTFCFSEEVEFMRSKGLALGGSLDNAVVVNKIDGILNQRGLRDNSEFVRHKMLDCLGDLHLIGGPLLGHVVAHKAGHDLHVQLAKEIHKYCGDRVTKLISKDSSESFWAQFKFPRSLSMVKRRLTNLAVG